MYFRDVTIQACSRTLLRVTPFPNKNPRCLSQKLTNGTRMTMVETNKNMAISFAPRENPATGRTRTTTARRRAMKRKCNTYITILVRPSQTRKLISSRSRASRHTHNIPIVAVKKNRGQEPRPFIHCNWSINLGEGIQNRHKKNNSSSPHAEIGKVICLEIYQTPHMTEAEKEKAGEYSLGLYGAYVDA